MIRHSTYILRGKKEVFGKLGIITAIVSIGYIGSVVWAHHIFTVGFDIDGKNYFISSTIVIAIPTGIKIFSWIITYYGRILKKNLLLLWRIGFLLLFSIGGFTGIILASAVLDIILHDTYYVVAHFHYVLSIGAIFGIFIGLIIWWNIIIGLQINFNLSERQFWIILIRVNITFFPQHFLGLNGMPRRIPEYSEIYQNWNIVRSIGSIIRVIRIIFFLFILLESLMRHRKIIFNNNFNLYYSNSNPCFTHNYFQNFIIIKFLIK